MWKVPKTWQRQRLINRRDGGRNLVEKYRLTFDQIVSMKDPNLQVSHCEVWVRQTSSLSYWHRLPAGCFSPRRIRTGVLYARQPG